MTHDELVTEFTIQNLKKNDLVIITLVDGYQFTCKLSDQRVSRDEDIDGKKLESRIGVLPPPAPKGKITGNAGVKTVLTKTIAKIKKAD